MHNDTACLVIILGDLW